MTEAKVWLVVSTSILNYEKQLEEALKEAIDEGFETEIHYAPCVVKDVMISYTCTIVGKK